MRRRRHMPLSVKLQAALHALGLLGLEIEWDHNPPLALRAETYDTAGNFVDYDPPANDPRYIVPMIKHAHRAKTNGKRHDVSDGDIHKVAKARKLSRKQEEFRQRMLARDPAVNKPANRKWPKREWPKKRKGYGND